MVQAKPKNLTASAEAIKALKEDDCYVDEHPTTPSSLLRILTLIIKKYSASAPKGMTSSLQALAALTHENNMSAQHTPPLVDAFAQKIGERMENTLQAELGKMSEIVKSSLTDRASLQNAVSTLGETAISLEKAAADMARSITEATTVTSQAASTARSYKEALINTKISADHPPAPSLPTQMLKRRTNKQGRN
ncbi:hypothetical protein H4582DRAFT_2068081 [Lactarius indigo]|nr:hypothetical protein H4582DRAFT_2068081 [Lactarius indigo]